MSLIQLNRILLLNQIVAVEKRWEMDPRPRTKRNVRILYALERGSSSA